MSIKFYVLKEKYIDYLRIADTRVQKNKKEGRPYIGIVYKIEGFDYFSPLSSPKDKHMRMKSRIDFIKIDNGNLGIINLNNSVPVNKDQLKLLDINSLKNSLKVEEKKYAITGAYQSSDAAISIGNSERGTTRQITGVAAGTEDTDAVNVAQLKALKESTEENTKEMTKQLHHLGEEIDGVRSEARGIGALSASLAALHPMQYDKAKPNQVMAGVGTYRDKQAVAVGMTHYFTENLMMTAGVSLAETSNTKAMANVGVTWKFGKGDDRGNLPEVYKEGPISSIQVMQDKMMNLENINKEQQTKIEMLEKQVKLLLENR